MSEARAAACKFAWPDGRVVRSAPPHHTALHVQTHAHALTPARPPTRIHTLTHTCGNALIAWDVLAPAAAAMAAKLADACACACCTCCTCCADTCGSVP